MTSIYDAELLLVDDNPDLLRLLCEQLSGAGYHHIRTAATCAAARAAFDAAPPHLMVLDINMPDGDGFSLFRALRAKSGRSGAVPLRTGCGCRPSVRAGSWRR